MPNVVYLDLPCKVYGATWFDPEGYQVIILNAKNSFERNLKAFKHERTHGNDFGLDVNVDQLEAERHEE